MKRKIKFRAYIKSLDIMLYDVAVYADGLIGIEQVKFERALHEKNPKYCLSEDGQIHHQDFEDEENEIFELLTSVLVGDEWIWLEEGQYELSQFINHHENGGEFNPIYEGDIMRISGIGKCVVGLNNLKYVFCDGNDYYDYQDIIEEVYSIIGNIWQNPEVKINCSKF